MLREAKERQMKMEMVILENLVPKNHLLRKIEKVINFSFIILRQILRVVEIPAPFQRKAVNGSQIFRCDFFGVLFCHWSNLESSFH